MENLEKWRNEMGLDSVKRPTEDVLKNAVELASENIGKIEPAELDKILMVLSNYYIFLKSQVGVIQSRVIYMEQMLDTNISTLAADVNAGHWQERRAIVLRSNEKIKALDKRLTEERVKLNMIGPFSDAIRVKIESIKKIFDRRVREKYVN